MNNPLPDIACAALSGSRDRLTVDSCYRDLAGTFRRHGLASPELDARLLLCAACGLSHERFAAAPERLVHADEAALIALHCLRRLEGEPVSRILGMREFWGLPFALSPETLDPRPDTETLVAALVELAVERRERNRPVSILDLGTGSGCILVSALRELPAARGVGSDIDPGALAIARLNADRLGVGARAQFVCGEWFDALAGRFDFLVSNPPYIPSGDIGALAPEVARFDPRAGLDGGVDGLDAYRKISAGAARILAPGGWVIFEVGIRQEVAVQRLLRERGFGGDQIEIRQFHDLSGIVRCVAARVLIERT